MLAGALVLAVLGASYQALATEQDRRAYPAPGQLADVGGHRLHLHTTGQATGTPTVILEAGAGMGSIIWAWVQPDVAQFTRVVAYDRAGIGWSDPGPEPRDAQHIAIELHTALGAAGIAGPYVLVGHSFGGLYVRVFADTYPDEVVGMVLVDASHPDQTARSPKEQQAIPNTLRLMQVLDGLARVGLVRLVNPVDTFFPGLPAPAAAEMRAYVAAGFAAGAVPELRVIETHTFPQVRAAGDLGHRPLAVLSAGDTLAQDPVCEELHPELAGLSSNSTHRVIQGANHGSLVLESRFAASIVDTIRGVVEAARTGQPLPGSH